MIEQVAKVLVDAGATHASAARAAVILDGGGTVAQAYAEIEAAPIQEDFDPRWLLTEIERVRTLAVAGNAR